VSGVQTVSARLDAEVAAQRLQFDESQRAAARRLDALGDELQARAPSFGERLRAALPWLPGDSARPPPRGVYLWGGVGRGKTLLMDWFFAAQPGGAERSHFYRFMREVHGALAGIKHHAQPLDLVAQRIAARSSLLCLDEFFVADIADAMILAGLLDGLFRRGVALVATSNSRPQDLYAEGLQRQRFLPAIELLGTLDIVHLGGIDYRLRQLERAPTYLDSNLPGTPAALRERFAEITGGAVSGPVALVIEGRTLQALNTGPGTVWFEFAELCEGPRSQNDYIEVARLYHTVFISNVPVFGPPNEDAARRFIMLLDEFYDRGVKLVVAAAAAPAALYRGERLAFEFERAASRLIEMQTHSYLAGQHRS
jgi:cell division protein ZapE